MTHKIKKFVKILILNKINIFKVKKKNLKFKFYESMNHYSTHI